jgi:hypothetical protein
MEPVIMMSVLAKKHHDLAIPDQFVEGDNGWKVNCCNWQATMRNLAG